MSSFPVGPPPVRASASIPPSIRLTNGTSPESTIAPELLAASGALSADSADSAVVSSSSADSSSPGVEVADLDSDDWEASLERYSRRGRVQTILGDEKPLPTSRSSVSDTGSDPSSRGLPPSPAVAAAAAASSGRLRIGSVGDRPPSSELASGKPVNWEESGQRWREIRAARPKWRPALNLFPVQESELEQLNEEPEQPKDFTIRGLMHGRGPFGAAPSPRDADCPPPPPPVPSSPAAIYSPSLLASDEYQQRLANSEPLNPVFVRSALDGARFIKHSRFGFAKPKLVRINFHSGILDWGSNFLSLHSAIRVTSEGKKGFFTIELKDRKLILEADTDLERFVWVEGLRQYLALIKRHEQGKNQESKQPAEESATAGSIVSEVGHLTEYSFDSFYSVLCRGREFVKHGKFGKPHVRCVKLNPSTGLLSWGTDGLIKLSHCTAIEPGKNTKLFEKVPLKVAHPSCCFSLIASERTLDLQAKSPEERNVWVKGLRELLERLNKGEKLPVDPNPSQPIIATGGQRALGLDQEELSSVARGKHIAHSTTRNDDHDGAADDDGEAMFQSVDETLTEEEFVQFRDRAVKGVSLIKHGRQGKPHAKKFHYMVDMQLLSWGSGSVSLHTVVQIERGKKTKVFEKESSRTAEPESCLSIITPERSVDIQCRDHEDREDWVKGLKELVRRARLNPVGPLDPILATPISLDLVDDDDAEEKETHHNRNERQIGTPFPKSSYLVGSPDSDSAAPFDSEEP